MESKKSLWLSSAPTCTHNSLGSGVWKHLRCLVTIQICCTTRKVALDSRIQVDGRRRPWGTWTVLHWSEGSIGAKTWLVSISWVESSLAQTATVHPDSSVQGTPTGTLPPQKLCLTAQRKVFVPSHWACLIQRQWTFWGLDFGYGNCNCNYK